MIVFVPRPLSRRTPETPHSRCNSPQVGSFSPGTYRVCIPPSTAMPPLTAQHAGLVRGRARSAMCSHRSSPRSSLHTPLLIPNPPHTTNPGRARSQTLTPSREARHTPVRRHAPTRPLCWATRVQNSGRARTREVAHREAARVLGAIEGARQGFCARRVCLSFCQKKNELAYTYLSRLELLS